MAKFGRTIYCCLKPASRTWQSQLLREMMLSSVLPIRASYAWREWSSHHSIIVVMRAGSNNSIRHKKAGATTFVRFSTSTPPSQTMESFAFTPTFGSLLQVHSSDGHGFPAGVCRELGSEVWCCSRQIHPDIGLKIVTSLNQMLRNRLVVVATFDNAYE